MQNFDLGKIIFSSCGPNPIPYLLLHNKTRFLKMYLVERLRPHLLQVGRRGLVDAHGGAVLQRLPLHQVIVGLHGSNLPEVLLRLGGLAVAPLLRVQGLATAGDNINQ